MDPTALLHMYQCWILDAHDSGDTDHLQRLIAFRNDLLTLRTGEARTYAAATRLDVLRQAAGELGIDVPDDKAA